MKNYKLAMITIITLTCFLNYGCATSIVRFEKDDHESLYPATRVDYQLYAGFWSESSKTEDYAVLVVAFPAFLLDGCISFLTDTIMVPFDLHRNYPHAK